MAKQIRTRKADKHARLSRLRHSASHILAEAILSLYPETKLGIGPATRDGFYYDFDFKHPLTDGDLAKIESEMKRLISEGRTFKKSEKTVAAALKWAKDNKQTYKVELINDLKKAGHKKLSFYTSLRRGSGRAGKFMDLCEGPHVKNTKDIGVIKLTGLAGAYWRGDERNPQLTRIYGTAFATNRELNAYLKQLEEAKKRDHRTLGEKLELFSFHPEGPGFPFWHPKGQRLFNTVIDYMRGILAESGYGEISTPPILNVDLWHKSGHWGNYKNNMYFTEIDKQKYAIKPMNCPGGMLVFNHRLHSYRELPIRTAEFGLVHRHELSGVLHGLFRVRSFTQDDAHVFCLPEQTKDEIKTLIRMLQRVYKDFGFKDYQIELSTRPSKSIGTDSIWERSEKIMSEVAKEETIDIQINAGEGAFYGPKFDFHVNDCLGRSWQLGTIQLDFSMPERLGAKYIDRKGKKQTPVMIHRAILGSVERFLGILIEHYGGALPLWLAPVQARVLLISPRHETYAKKIAKELVDNGLFIEIDSRNETIGKKIREAELEKIPYMLVIGDKEVKSKSIAVRRLDKGDVGAMKIPTLVKKMEVEIESKK